MKYRIGEFWNGNVEDLISSESGFTLRNGGADQIICYCIQDDEETIAFVPDLETAKIIVSFLNGREK